MREAFSNHVVFFRKVTQLSGHGVDEFHFPGNEPPRDFHAHLFCHRRSKKAFSHEDVNHGGTPRRVRLTGQPQVLFAAQNAFRAAGGDLSNARNVRIRRFAACSGGKGLQSRFSGNRLNFFSPDNEVKVYRCAGS